MTATSNLQAYQLSEILKNIQQRGGHAALDFRAGELVLMCTKPDAEDPETWGRGAVPQPYGGDWVRLFEF